MMEIIDQFLAYMFTGFVDLKNSYEDNPPIFNESIMGREDVSIEDFDSLIFFDHLDLKLLTYLNRKGWLNVQNLKSDENGVGTKYLVSRDEFKRKFPLTYMSAVLGEYVDYRFKS